MTKRYCDICEQPTLQFDRAAVLAVPLKYPSGDEQRLELRAQASVQGKGYGDICRQCFVDMLRALASQIDGTSQTPATAPHS